MKLAKLRRSLQKLELDSILITNPYNIRYMTGFTGTSAVAIVSKDEAVLFTDFRYIEQAKVEVSQFRVEQYTSPVIKKVAQFVTLHRLQSLGFEKDSMSFGLYELYKANINVKFQPVSNIIEKIRLIKTPEEINIIKVACKIADSAFMHILNYIEPGKTELDVSNELEIFMRKQGATSSSFDTIVASGVRSALPHGVATDKIIEKGDFVTLDFGALYNGYISDITRTVAVGQPSAKLLAMYDAVLEAQLLAVQQIGPGMTGAEADAIARNFLKVRGYGDAFGHSLGHGIGMQLHEGPSLNYLSQTLLEKNMTVTVEPGVYLPGIGGVRIEDDIIITESGNEILTHSTKELIIL